MKKFFTVILILSVIVSVGMLFTKPLIVYLAQKQLGKIFIKSRVTVGKCAIDPLRGVSLSNIKITSPDISDLKIENAHIRFNFFPGIKMNRFELKIDSFQAYGIKLKNASLNLRARLSEGDFSISEISYDKLNIVNTQGSIKLNKNTVNLGNISAQTLSGTITGAAAVEMKDATLYQMTLHCRGISIERLVKDFKLQEKFNMSGTLNGTLELGGTDAQITLLGGNFATLPPGGVLIITDTEMLKTMANNMHQPEDLFVETMKNYEYNTGLVKLGLEKNNITLAVGLDGENGKRTFNLILHNFIKGKEHS